MSGLLGVVEMSDIITGPGLYVLRNGQFVAIVKADTRWALPATGPGWSGLKGHWLHDRDSSLDIIRRATPDEAARFCGIGEMI